MRRNKIRFIYMIIAGIIISKLLDTIIAGVHPEHNQLIDFCISIGITILVWEGNLRIDSLMNKKFPWEKSPGKRILVHLPVSVIFSAFVIHMSMLAFNKFVCPMPEETKSAFMITAIILGVLISIIILSVEIGTQFFGNWKRSLLEIEKYKTENLQAQLQNLKDQLNPHFLFNNLSVLSSLVYIDQDKAVGFINQLSKVYRYLLDNRNCELVTLDSELTFIQSYTYLIQIRFDKNISFDIDIPKDKMHLMLPPLSLQMLIENAIKHNEISNELPLKVSVKMNGEMIEVQITCN
ncbi:MAG: sensor histidine kinase [Bacteroidetes bacterium]|nr:sensor histidine kinase [Bacteroidota bacterium]